MEANVDADPTKQMESIINYFGRHFVCLVFSYVALDNDGKEVGQDQLFGISAFVMSFYGEWFVVTAGHAIKEGIEDNVKKGAIKVKGSVTIQDNLGPDAKFPYPTIIDYEGASKWRIDDERLGLDVEVIHLREFFRKGLQSNGVVPIEEKNWLYQTGAPHDFYLLYGIPDELTSPTEVVPGLLGTALQAQFTRILLHVDRLKESHRPLDESVFPWFIGRVRTETYGLRSIKGMSGGPIFGFNTTHDGSLRYWVVALQSWWDKDSKTIYGCPVPFFARIVRGIFFGDDDAATDEVH